MRTRCLCGWQGKAVCLYVGWSEVVEDAVSSDMMKEWSRSVNPEDNKGRHTNAEKKMWLL